MGRNKLDRAAAVLLGRRIAEERKFLGMSRPSLAKEMGCDLSFLSRLERGEVGLSIDKARQISRILGVTIDRLVGVHGSQLEA